MDMENQHEGHHGLGGGEIRRGEMMQPPHILGGGGPPDQEYTHSHSNDPRGNHFSPGMPQHQREGEPWMPPPPTMGRDYYFNGNHHEGPPPPLSPRELCDNHQYDPVYHPQRPPPPRHHGHPTNHPMYDMMPYDTMPNGPPALMDQHSNQPFFNDGPPSHHWDMQHGQQQHPSQSTQPFFHDGPPPYHWQHGQQQQHPAWPPPHHERPYSPNEGGPPSSNWDVALQMKKRLRDTTASTTTPEDPRPQRSEGKKPRWSRAEKRQAQPAAEAPSGPRPPRHDGRVKPLIVLDLNGILCHRVREWHLPPGTVFRPSIAHVANTEVVPRSDLREFLTLLHEHFRLAVWTSATPKTARRLVNELFPWHIQERLVFVWHRFCCDLIEKTDEEKTDAEKTNTASSTAAQKREDGNAIGVSSEKEGGAAGDDKKGDGDDDKLSVGCSREKEAKGDRKEHDVGRDEEGGSKDNREGTIDHGQLSNGGYKGGCKEEGSAGDEKGDGDPNTLSGVGCKDNGSSGGGEAKGDIGHMPDAGCKEESSTHDGKENGDHCKLPTGGYKEEGGSNSCAKGGGDPGTLSPGGCKDYNSKNDGDGDENLLQKESNKEGSRDDKKGDSENGKLSDGGCNEEDSKCDGKEDKSKMSDGGCRDGGPKSDGKGTGNNCKSSEVGCEKERSTGDRTVATSLPVAKKEGIKRRSHKDVTAIKSLSKVWSRFPRWNATNTLLIDDSPEKCPRQFSGNVVHPPPLCGTVTYGEGHEGETSNTETAETRVKAGSEEKNDAGKARSLVDDDEVNQRTQRNFFTLLARHWAEATSSPTQTLAAFLEAHAKDHNMGWQMSQLPNADVE